MMSNQKIALLESYKKGYRVINGEVISPFSGKPRSLYPVDEYLAFSVKVKCRSYHVFVHRLVAYQKYGDRLFNEGIETRHLDNDSKNNFEDNIVIGTHQENMLDIPKEQRIINAGHRKYPYEEIKTFHSKTKSYKMTMKKFQISSKGTLNNILKTDGETRQTRKI